MLPSLQFKAQGKISKWVSERGGYGFVAEGDENICLIDMKIRAGKFSPFHRNLNTNEDELKRN
jgi:hypothetical protein